MAMLIGCFAAILLCAISSGATQPKFFWLLWLLGLIAFGLGALGAYYSRWQPLPEQCPHDPETDENRVGSLFFGALAALLLGFALCFRFKETLPKFRFTGRAGRFTDHALKPYVHVYVTLV